MLSPADNCNLSISISSDQLRCEEEGREEALQGPHDDACGR